MHLVYKVLWEVYPYYLWKQGLVKVVKSLALQIRFQMINSREHTIFKSTRSMYLHRNIKKFNYNLFSFGHSQMFMIKKITWEFSKIWISGTHPCVFWFQRSVEHTGVIVFLELFNTIFNKAILIKRFGNLQAILD